MPEFIENLILATPITCNRLKVEECRIFKPRHNTVIQEMVRQRVSLIDLYDKVLKTDELMLLAGRHVNLFYRDYLPVELGIAAAENNISSFLSCIFRKAG
jgi:hypothetical protein